MIFLVRHGEAAASWAEAADPGLSARGRRQADAAAETLIAAGATRPVTSPMEVEHRVSEIETPEGLANRSEWLSGVMSGDWGEAEHDFAPWRTAALEAIQAAPDGSVFFTHFVAINAVVGLLEGVEKVVVFKPAHCSITRLERSAGGLHVARRGEEGESRVL